MAGFFKRLFGGGDDASAAPEPAVTYKGIEITPAPMKEEGGNWRIAGHLTRPGDPPATRRFMRADLLPGRDAAVEASIGKAKLIIDQNGEQLWTGDPDRPV